MTSLSNKEKQILDSHREILWLKRQIQQFKDEDNFVPPEIPEEATEENIKHGINMYREHINNMRIQLDVATLSNKNKEEILKAIDEHYFTINSLYPNESESDEMNIKQETKKLIDERDELVVQFMKKLEELKELKHELTSLQGGTIKSHMENREILSRVTELQKEIDDIIVTDRTREIHQSIREQRNYIATIRGVLTGLILESDVDWVNNKNLLATMTRIGEEI